MARLRRIVLPGQAHVIVHRGHNGQAVFADDRDREVYLSALRDAARESTVAVHAYGLFANEVRLLATPHDETGLARTLQAVGRRFVRHLNARHGRSGTPWDGRFRSTAIEAEPHFLACAQFVEGLVGRPDGGPATAADREAPRSSAAHHLAGRADALVVAHPAYWRIGNTPFEREAAYSRLAARPAVASELAAIGHAAAHGWVLGSAQFAADAARRTGRRARPAPRGRPVANV